MMKQLVIIVLFLWEGLLIMFSQTPLSLSDYREKVLNYNQDFQIAKQTIAAAQEVVKESHAGFLPSVSASASYSYNFNPLKFSLGDMQAQLQSANWSAGGEVIQPVYSGGDISATYNAAKIQQEIASLSADLSADNIIYFAEITYWNTVSGNDYVKLSEQYLNILNQLYEVVKNRFNDGLISKTDLLKIETSLEQAVYQNSKARQMLTNSYILLNILMGVPVEDQVQLTDSLSEKAPISIFSINEVLNRRPDYLIKGKEVELQKQMGKIDQSEFLPKLGIGASANYGTPTLNLTGDPLWSPIVFAQFRMPVFEWGKSRHSRNKNKAILISKELEQSATADNIRKELNMAMNDIIKSKEQNEIASKTLKIAQESLDLHTFSYGEGQVPILDVQSAQLSWLQAGMQVIESQLNCKKAMAAYKKAVSQD